MGKLKYTQEETNTKELLLLLYLKKRIYCGFAVVLCSSTARTMRQRFARSTKQPQALQTDTPKTKLLEGSLKERRNEVENPWKDLIILPFT